MLFRMSLEKEWRNLCIGFYELLLEGCLDDAKIVEIHWKIQHHKSRLTDTVAAAAVDVKV